MREDEVPLFFLTNYHSSLITSLEGDADGLHDLAQDFFGLLAAAVERGGEARVDDEAVREDGEDEPLHVVGQAVVAPLRERERLRGAEERERAAGADAEV